MRRILVAGMVLVVVTVAAWPRDRDPGIRPGPWHGETSQGHPMSFIVEEVDGDLTLDQWVIQVDLRCEATGRLVGLALWLGMPVPITDRHFAARHADLSLWTSWSGGFSAEDAARGAFALVWPALIGEELAELRSEKCSAVDLVWTARPGEADDEDRADAPDLQLRVDRDGRVTRM
jgi:hypothetical protein